MATEARDPADVVIVLRTGYATLTLWHDALAGALSNKRTVVAIDGAGQRVDAAKELAAHGR
jgi:hypothetical protein